MTREKAIQVAKSFKENGLKEKVQSYFFGEVRKRMQQVGCYVKIPEEFLQYADKFEVLNIVRDEKEFKGWQIELSENDLRFY